MQQVFNANLGVFVCFLVLNSYTKSYKLWIKSKNIRSHIGEIEILNKNNFHFLCFYYILLKFKI